MANHFEIQTTQKLTQDFVDKHINEYVDKWMFNLFDVDYLLDNGEPFWNISLKDNNDYQFSFYFWINDEYNLEFRHSGKSGIIKWIENNWFEYFAKQVENPKLYDEGVGYFGFTNNFDKYDGYKDYKESSISEEANLLGRNKLEKFFMTSTFKRSAFKNIPESLTPFLENYKENANIYFRNKNIDSVTRE